MQLLGNLILRCFCFAIILVSYSTALTTRPSSLESPRLLRTNDAFVVRNLEGQSESDSNAQQFLSSSSSALVATVAALCVIGVFAILVVIFIFLVACHRRYASKVDSNEFPSVKRNQTETADSSENGSLPNTNILKTVPFSKEKRKSEHAFSNEVKETRKQTLKQALEPISMTKLPAPRNVDETRSIASFLESAGRAYDDLQGRSDNRRQMPSRKNNFDLAGLTLCSEAPTFVNGKLGAGQNASNATVADASLVSVYTMSELYPEDFGVYGS